MNVLTRKNIFRLTTWKNSGIYMRTAYIPTEKMSNCRNVEKYGG